MTVEAGSTAEPSDGARTSAGATVGAGTDAAAMAASTVMVGVLASGAIFFATGAAAGPASDAGNARSTF